MIVRDKVTNLTAGKHKPTSE